MPSEALTMSDRRVIHIAVPVEDLSYLDELIRDAGICRPDRGRIISALIGDARRRGLRIETGQITIAYDEAAV
jgi:hypothetical protein